MKSFGKQLVKSVNVSNKSWREVLIVTILTSVGAGLTYLLGNLASIDMNKLGQYGPLVMTVLMPFISYLKTRVQEQLNGRHIEDSDFKMIK